MTTTEIAQRSPVDIVISGVRSDTFKQQIAKVLPPSVTADRFERIAVTALQQNPKIAECTTDSIIRSLLRCAQDGLLPDGKEAALVEFNKKIKEGQTERWEKQAQYMPMIGGFRKIAADHGWSLSTAVVYEHDEFQQGLIDGEERITHLPVRPGAERGPMIAAYAVAKHKDGRRETEVMTAADIEQVRQSSKSKDSGPWKDWPGRMWEKTVGRRLFAKLPLADSDLEREKLKHLLEESDLAPGDAQRALYGNTDRLALAPAADSPVDAKALTTGPPAPTEHTGEHPQADDAAKDTQTPSAAASPVPGQDTDDEPDIGGSAVTTADDGTTEAAIELAANNAALFAIPNGKHRGVTLGELLQVEDGLGWLKWALQKIEQPQEYVDALWNFSRFFAADLYQEALAKKEASVQS